MITISSVNKFISIIVPVFNGENYIKKCLDSLCSQSYPESAYEIILVDNGSTDNGITIAKSYKISNLKILYEEKKSSYAARNKGIYAAVGDVIGFIDIDCIADNEWVKNAVHIFNADPEVSYISGMIELFNKGDDVTAWGIYDKNRFLNQESGIDKGSFKTANLFVRKSLFEEIGMFNSDFVSGEDINWTQRASKMGYKYVYCPDVKVYHPLRNSFSELAKKCYRVGFGKGQVAKRRKRYFFLISLKTILPNPYSTIRLLKGQGFFKSCKLLFATVCLNIIEYTGNIKGYLNDYKGI